MLESNPIRFGRDENGVQLVFVGECDVTLPIRDNQVTNNVSVAALPLVGKNWFIYRKLHKLVVSSWMVRDIGTIVLPSSELKIFLIASVEERALRRFKENTERHRN